jgi:hypothetical protein
MPDKEKQAFPKDIQKLANEQAVIEEVSQKIKESIF